MKVLVVDDNTDAADMLAMLVRSFGFEVHVEYGPQAALDHARSHPARLCLLDIGMPVMDGYELARRLRHMPAMYGALLVSVSGFGRDDRRNAGPDAVFDHQLTQPVDVKQLEAILAKAPASQV